MWTSPKIDNRYRYVLRSPISTGSCGYDHSASQNGGSLDPLHDTEIDQAAGLLQDLSQLQDSWEGVKRCALRGLQPRPGHAHPGEERNRIVAQDIP